LIIVLAVLLAWRDWSMRPVEHAAGVLLAAVPRQSAATDAAEWQLDDFRVIPRARFELSARLLSRERYYWGASAGLSPIDLALGWGPMSDQSVVDRIDVSQGARWFILRFNSTPPVSIEQMMKSSANMHIIPANDTVRKQVLSLRRGELVQLRGQLVDVRGDDGFSWSTSLTRDDTGGGSCELFYVEWIQRLQPNTPSSAY
jgi:hypothetical protein